MKFKVLSAKNPAHCGDVWAELDDLYIGGYRLQRNAEKYLHRVVGESARRYTDRLRCIGYVNYFAQIVDSFVAGVFSKGVSVSPAEDADNRATIGGKPSDEKFWQTFASDADRCGTPFDRVLRAALGTALVKGCAYVACDFPSVAAPVSSRAEEDALGAARGYCFEVDPLAVLDWEKGDEGRFSWAILHRCVQRRASPESERGSIVDEFKVWRVTESGDVTWELYQAPPRAADKKPDPEAEVALVSGPHRTSFKEIPIVGLELPEGLWVGNKVGPLAREHFQRRSALISAENKSLFAIPVVKLGPEVGAAGGEMPSDAQQDPQRGDDPVQKFEAQGHLKLGADDSFEFASPDGGAYTVVDEQLKSLVDEMFRVGHQMAASIASTANAVGRSGDSKAEDRAVTETVSNALGALVRDFAQRLYAVISEARGESVVWSVHGLDGHKSTDRTALLNEALQVDKIGIPSGTFQRLYKLQIATGLLGDDLEPSTLAAVREEIAKATAAVDTAGTVTSGDDAGPKLSLAPTDIASIVSVNEARASQGFGPWPGEDGKLSVTAFQAKNAEIVAAAANAAAGQPDGQPPPAPSFGGGFGGGGAGPKPDAKEDDDPEEKAA